MIIVNVGMRLFYHQNTLLEPQLKLGTISVLFIYLVQLPTYDQEYLLLLFPSYKTTRLNTSCVVYCKRQFSGNLLVIRKRNWLLKTSCLKKKNHGS